jgi:hypothetical protein
MKKLLFFLLLGWATFMLSQTLHAQDSGGKKSKKTKGMGTQEDLDQDVQEGKERGMTKEDKKNLAKKKKEVEAKRKKDEITRRNADKIADKRYNGARKKVAKKKKNWVKSRK